MFFLNLFASLSTPRSHQYHPPNVQYMPGSGMLSLCLPLPWQKRNKSDAKVAFCMPDCLSRREDFSRGWAIS